MFLKTVRFFGPHCMWWRNWSLSCFTQHINVFHIFYADKFLLMKERRKRKSWASCLLRRVLKPATMSNRWS